MDLTNQKLSFIYSTLCDSTKLDIQMIAIAYISFVGRQMCDQKSKAPENAKKHLQCDMILITLLIKTYKFKKPSQILSYHINKKCYLTVYIYIVLYVVFQIDIHWNPRGCRGSPVNFPVPLVRKNSRPKTDPRSKALRRNCDTSSLSGSLARGNEPSMVVLLPM